MTEVTICEVCNGNGFVRVPHSIYADQFEIDQCHTCRSSGEVQNSLQKTEDWR